MHSDSITDPDNRAVYADGLRAPPGYRLTAAVATTYSLDFETALSVPLSLAMFGADSSGLPVDQVALLEALERTINRLVIFSQDGCIQAADRQSRLCVLLEDVIHPVRAPKAPGVFHPKLWLLRFGPDDPASVEPERMRLLVLSRNLTQDRSWDMSVLLDGTVTRRPKAQNCPLVEFLTRLPDLVLSPLDDCRLAMVVDMAEAVHRTDWHLPPGFDELNFHIIGFSKNGWLPPRSNRMAVISPFLEPEAVGALVTQTHKPLVLVSRPDELAKLPAELLQRFCRVCSLNSLAEEEDGEDTGGPVGLSGLHAKIYIAEEGWRTRITLGSANATNAALLNGRNVEILVSLAGQRARIGGIADLLGKDSLGRLLRDFKAEEARPIASDAIVAAKRLEDGRDRLCRAGLVLRCTPAAPGEGEPLWQVDLVPNGPVDLTEITQARAWLVTTVRDQGQSLVPLSSNMPIVLASLGLGDICRFVAFELKSDVVDVPPLTFTLPLPLDGLPSGRQAAVVAKIVATREEFLRYLRFLLIDLVDPITAAALRRKMLAGTWLPADCAMPLLEDMVRALVRDPALLIPIRRLLARLDEAAHAGGEDIVPTDFRQLWAAFENMIPSLPERAAPADNVLEIAE